MEKLKVSIFEALGFLFPGFLILCGVVVLIFPTLNNLIPILEYTESINAIQIIGVLGLSYFIGFIINNIGYELFTSIGLKVWKIRDEVKDEYKSNQSKIVLIRHFSPSNYLYIEKWLAYRAMSHNLALSSFFLGIVLIVAFFKDDFKTVWIVVGVFCLFSTLPLLYRATLYEKLYYTDVNNSIKELGLEEVARKVNLSDILST